MANSNNYLGRPSYRFLSKPTDISDSGFEFHEFDLYSSDESRVHGCGMPNKPSCSSKLAVGRSDSSSSSLPINIPDWYKILGNQCRQNRALRDEVDEQVRDDGGVVVPPHEFLANTRMASMSVQEGIGRTVKGRDLSRVRNAVWAKTGFQD